MLGSSLENKQPLTPRSRGFTLVELAIAVVIIGVLAAFGVPRYLTAVERSKASEAFDYLWTVQSSQERYQALHGTYSGAIDKLDTGLEAPEYFSVGRIVVPRTASSLETGWQLTLTRSGASGGYGKYTVVFTQDGFERDASTIDPGVSPLATLAGASSSGDGAGDSGGDDEYAESNSGAGSSNGNDGNAGNNGDNGNHGDGNDGKNGDNGNNGNGKKGGGDGDDDGNGKDKGGDKGKDKGGDDKSKGKGGDDKGKDKGGDDKGKGKGGDNGKGGKKG